MPPSDKGGHCALSCFHMEDKDLNLNVQILQEFVKIDLPGPPEGQIHLKRHPVGFSLGQQFGKVWNGSRAEERPGLGCWPEEVSSLPPGMLQGSLQREGPLIFTRTEQVQITLGCGIRVVPTRMGVVGDGT